MALFDEWVEMSNIQFTRQHEDKYDTVFEAVINAGGEDCLTTRVSKLEYDMGNIRSHRKWLKAVAGVVAADIVMRVLTFFFHGLK